MKKDERGFASLIVLLISLALILALMAMVSINLVQIGQAKNEQNATEGVTALMQAEAGYIAAFPSSGYATGTNLHHLSDCPAPVTQNGKTTVTPTAIAACQSVSATYTNNKQAYGYTFAVISTVGPDGLAGTSDDGFLITATPQNKALGRLTYCANNQDGLLRGQIEGVTPTTAGACDAFSVIAAGTSSSPPAPASNPTVYSRTFPFTVNQSTLTGPTTVQLSGLNLPTGTYLIRVSSTIVDGGQGNYSTVCFLADSGTLSSSSNITMSTPTPPAAGSAVPFILEAITTYSGSGDVITLNCGAPNNFRWQGNPNFTMNSANAQNGWGIGPTLMTATLITNTPQ